MRTLATTAALVLGAAFVSVGLGVPAHADCEWTFPGSVMWQKCMNDPGVQIADASSTTPFCLRPWPGGVNKPCSDCTSAINNDNGLKPQVDFDCGASGGINQYGGKAHCAVAGVPTGRQPDCLGDLQADGSVIVTN